MNGLGLPAAQPTAAELRAQLALAEACEPIQQENLDAKQAYRDALERGDAAEIAAAKERKQAAAHQINETRTWLRREARIAKLQALIPALEEDLSKPHWRPTSAWRPEEHRHLEEARERLAAMKAELPALEADAAPLREVFESLPVPVPPFVLEDGSAQVDLPPVAVKSKTMKGGR
ncbi:hypothetical protein OG884_26475 [Streptosporangium sp. NBC_01755]|uniref:hypothetical protein n=1 Tax=Streptosporangium sp. NBC_01755 TaxID=2975949 RepID=UPI002DDB381B|nr:hypothetical protein [Streptosporangium sp. NBC_01755]WSC98395.1 hypothetical protein OG884_26475 [Streptosporangium sp. NBC_01755]